MLLQPLACVLAVTGWTLLHTFGIVVFRVAEVLLRRAKVTTYKSDYLGGPLWYQRLMRSHRNCVENLILFAVVVFAMLVSGARPENFELFCNVYVLARMGQSIAHLIAEDFWFVNIRFSFFMVQLGSLILMSKGLVEHLISANLIFM